MFPLATFDIADRYQERFNIYCHALSIKPVMKDALHFVLHAEPSQPFEMKLCGRSEKEQQDIATALLYNHY